MEPYEIPTEPKRMKAPWLKPDESNIYIVDVNERKLKLTISI
jgi:hypothetical protein